MKFASGLVPRKVGARAFSRFTCLPVAVCPLKAISKPDAVQKNDDCDSREKRPTVSTCRSARSIYCALSAALPRKQIVNKISARNAAPIKRAPYLPLLRCGIPRSRVLGRRSGNVVSHFIDSLGRGVSKRQDGPRSLGLIERPTGAA